jgi:hypothetical protein
MLVSVKLGGVVAWVAVVFVGGCGWFFARGLVWFGLMLTCYQVAFFNVDACFFDILF